MMKIHHIGYLVKKFDKAIIGFEKLGFILVGDIIRDEFRLADLCFMEKDGYIVELVSPYSRDSVVADLIKTYRNSPYHICYESRNFYEDIKKYETNGFVKIDEPRSAIAFRERNVIFLMNPYIGMIEILEGTDD